MTEQFSGRTSAYEHKFDNWKESPTNGRECVRNVKFFDVQWSNCPIEVEEVVKQLWRFYELGNDRYIIKTSIEYLTELQGPDYSVSVEWRVDGEWKEVEINIQLLIDFLRFKGVTEEEQIIIHWWW